MIDPLRRGAARSPDQVLVVTVAGALTYAEVLEAAESLSRRLGELEIGSGGVAFAVADPATMIPLFAAASALGVAGCAYPVDRSAAELATIAARFDQRPVLTDRAHLAGELPGAIAVDDLPPAGTATGAPDAAEQPVVVLTTGTTGEPKGALHDWRRLTRAVEGRGRPGTRWLYAYMPNTFAGVNMLIHAVANEATLVVPRSLAPVDALAAIEQHGVTHVSATPTFWRLLVGHIRRTGASPPPLEQVTLGGEAVGEAVLAELRELFPDARISHIYASSEFGLSGSVRDGRHGLPISVLERDENADVQLKVVDGELWARSRLGMARYLGQEAGAPGEWRPTGDLVEIREGRLYFTGRVSEVINVGGTKVAPLPVEEVIGAVPGVRLVRVYGRPNPVTGNVVAAEVQADEGVDPAELKRRIQEACQAALPETSRPRAIKFVDELTTSGTKVVRRAAT